MKKIGTVVLGALVVGAVIYAVPPARDAVTHAYQEFRSEYRKREKNIRLALFPDN